MTSLFRGVLAPRGGDKDCSDFKTKNWQESFSMLISFIKVSLNNRDFTYLFIYYKYNRMSRYLSNKWGI